MGNTVSPEVSQYGLASTGTDTRALRGTSRTVNRDLVPTCAVRQQVLRTNYPPGNTLNTHGRRWRELCDHYPPRGNCKDECRDMRAMYFAYVDERMSTITSGLTVTLRRLFDAGEFGVPEHLRPPIGMDAVLRMYTENAADPTDITLDEQLVWVFRNADGQTEMDSVLCPRVEDVIAPDVPETPRFLVVSFVATAAIAKEVRAEVRRLTEDLFQPVELTDVPMHAGNALRRHVLRVDISPMWHFVTTPFPVMPDP